ncbi:MULTISPECIES: hypothetical protein [Leptolyngbya]|uniref:hypothetical protein n=1 Tax=Leptolyngbya TaxID=47251 RepID=UPI00168994D8|nr:hypothetical protein [Leptolyngbya sp. FACHB-1624]MBD1859214.1 hypothetical protein [Leptolyngbya sp. FACHB-1624]
MSTLRRADGEPRYLVVGKYNFDPNIQDGDEVWVNWEVGGKQYNLKTKVIARKKEIYPHPDMRNLSEETKRNGMFMLRVFVEAEDRDAVIEMCESISIERNNATFNLQEKP